VVFQDLFATGASIPAGATLDATGNGAFEPNTTQSFGQGHRSNQIFGHEVSTQDGGFIGSNGNPLAVSVDWQNHTCELSGSIFGQIESADTNITADLAGTIINEPTTANAGGPQTVECTSPSGAQIMLDGSHSSDPEDNIALYVWRQGTRSGPELGDAAVVEVNSGFGRQPELCAQSD
jgi:hypothetical protein